MFSTAHNRNLPILLFPVWKDRRPTPDIAMFNMSLADLESLGVRWSRLLESGKLVRCSRNPAVCAHTLHRRSRLIDLGMIFMTEDS